MQTDQSETWVDELRQSKEATDVLYLTVPQVAKSIPSGRNGRPTHTATVVRWITSGSKGPSGELVHLRAVRLGGRWLTTREWLDQFMARLTPSFDTAQPVRSATARTRETSRAGAALKAAGF